MEGGADERTDSDVLTVAAFHGNGSKRDTLHLCNLLKY